MGKTYRNGEGKAFRDYVRDSGFQYRAINQSLADAEEYDYDDDEEDNEKPMKWEE